ncbi:MAG: hypothetical protein NTX30_15600 [Deltaproteobacteria bacterium]|jgi:hypothetical protein|nr:hypothetical protein [Deltaproteobacteria bacterium]
MYSKERRSYCGDFPGGRRFVPARYTSFSKIKTGEKLVCFGLIPSCQQGAYFTAFIVLLTD